MEHLIQVLDIPTAARLRTVSKEWKELVDRERSREDFLEHARKNTILVEARDGSKGKNFNIIFENVVDATGDDVLRRLGMKSEWINKLYVYRDDECRNYYMRWLLPILSSGKREIDLDQKLMRRGYITIVFYY